MKIVLQKFNIKNNKSNSNVNISKVLWYSAKFTDNGIVSQKDLWFRAARLVRQNNDCVICFFFFWSVLRDPIACSLLGVDILSQNSGYKVTRLCPSIMLSFYFVPPPSFPARCHFYGHSVLLAYRLPSVQFHFCRCPLICPIQI